MVGRDRTSVAAAVVTLAGSGLRIGELLGLDVTDVDFLRRTISVERQRNQAGNLGPTQVEVVATGPFLSAGL